MSLNRREFLQILAAAGMAGLLPTPLRAQPSAASELYDLPAFGNVSLLHITDCHAQLLPMYYREPDTNLGIGIMQGKPPHLVGEQYLKYYGLKPDSAQAYAFTAVDFAQAAHTYGQVGGFAHLKTLLDQLRAQRPGALLLDGGDSWQGSWTALQTQGQDMVAAQLALGVNVMTAHWEMTLGAERVQTLIKQDLAGKIDFVAQNIVTTDFEEPVFAPYVIREINQVPVAIIGQAFPYTPIANPKHLIPDWSFGIRPERLQAMIKEARGKGAQVVVLLSHNGMDVDLKLASQVSGLDAILGGHTHDAVLQPVIVENAGGKTLVTNAGSNGKFVAVLDLEVKAGKVADYRYRLLPVLANCLKADTDMLKLIEKVRAPYAKVLSEPLAVCDELLYRRGNFNGTFDQLICNALRQELDAPIAFSPGFRWGTSLLPGQTITFEDVAAQTAITYPTVTRRLMSGQIIKAVLEDVADNLFNPDPYYQQGGDMVRVGGLQFSLDPTATMGKRIGDLSLAGKPLQADKDYPVAGWASVQANVPANKPIWEVVATYLRQHKTLGPLSLNRPVLKNVATNPGLGV